MKTIPNEQISHTLTKLMALSEVATALQQLKDTLAYSIEEQKELTLCEAPTFQEDKRAKLIAQKMQEIGLSDVHIDAHGNAVGMRKGREKGTIMIEAHMDTVFPFGSATEIREENGRLYAPGIRDNTRGVAVVLAIARAMEWAQIQNTKGIYFVATVCEEGKGGMKGMSGFVEDHPELSACICIDGNGDDTVTFEATGMVTMAAHFHGIGGHAYSAFGSVANPLHAAARAVSKIADLQVPIQPKTTFAVSNFHAGNEEGIHAIVKDATIKINFRSNGSKELKQLKDQVLSALAEACEEESKRWGKDVITHTVEFYLSDDAGTQELHSPLIQSAYAAISAIGRTPSFREGGSTNASAPILKGYPAVCLGCGGLTGGVHTVDEWFDPTEAEKAEQIALLTLLLVAGISEKSASTL